MAGSSTAARSLINADPSLAVLARDDNKETYKFAHPTQAEGRLEWGHPEISESGMSS
jgi:hypothetical protein